MDENGYVIAKDLYYEEVIRNVKCSKDPLQPIYEAFTNSYESIALRKQSLPDADINSTIDIRLYMTPSTSSDAELFFSKLEIDDNGIGFDEVNFNRFNCFRDNRKGYKNRGSGRIQFIHAFQSTHVRSVFLEGEKKYCRTFLLSKDFSPKHNAIVKTSPPEEVTTETPLKTTLIFRQPLWAKIFYDSLNLDAVKESLISHYIMQFCSQRDHLPQISLSLWVNDDLKDTLSISSMDIPEIDNSMEISVPYKKLTNDGKALERTNINEQVTIHAFKIEKPKLSENKIQLTSKNQLVSKPRIELDGLSDNDVINGERYLFLLTSNYFDTVSEDNRDLLPIFPEEHHLEKASANQELFAEDFLVLEDL